MAFGKVNIGGISAVDKQALIDIANSADLNQSSIKTNLANALNTKTGSNLTLSSTWSDIQNAISNMTNKKFASGIVTTDSNGRATITGLSFSPSIVYIKYSNGTNNYSYFLISSALEQKYNNNSSGLVKVYLNGAVASTSAGATVGTLRTNDDMTSDGFKCSTLNAGVFTLEWYAWA